MDKLIQYNKERSVIEGRFHGLRLEQTTLIKSLITLADPTTGIVNNISYHGLAKILTVKPAPGRKDSGSPSKQTIRNYIKSTERECGEYFKVISEGQTLKFLFPELPIIFSKIFENAEVNTDINSSETHINTGEIVVFEDKLNSDLNMEVNTPNAPVKKLLFNINNNKQTNSSAAVIVSAKKTIRDNFYPDAETIEIALSKGYSNVIEPTEIEAFIKHNKTNQTQWTDFNPVFLRWLERNAEYQAQQKQKTLKQLRSTNHERRTYQKPTQQSAIERVAQHHGISPSSLWDEQNNEHNGCAVIEGTLIETMVENDCDLRSAFY